MITPNDRGALIVFNDHPLLAVKLTNQLQALAAGLAGLKAERGTSLYDSVVFSLFYFNGVKGQRALLLLSDGKDEGSRFNYEESLDFARRAGVAVYPIGLDIPRTESEMRKVLKKLAEETGGRNFFVKDPSELPAIYDAIQLELRSRYLLAYQSTNPDRTAIPDRRPQSRTARASRRRRCAATTPKNRTAGVLASPLRQCPCARSPSRSSPCCPARPRPSGRWRLSPRRRAPEQASPAAESATGRLPRRR